MRVAVFSDIHANLVALDAVLEDIRRQPVDRMVCLGDCIQGGPQPAEVVDRLRSLECPVVMGNSDAWLLSGIDSGNEVFTSDRRRRLEEIRAWSLSRLSAEDRAFITGFAPTVELELKEGLSLLGFHGSPTSFDDFLLPHTPEAEFRRLLEPFSRHILTGGHMHIQHVRRLRSSFFFNPGSVGVTYDHEQDENDVRLDPWAEYAVLTADGGRIGLEFRRVPFDVAAYLRAHYENGRPYPDEAVAAYASRVREILPPGKPDTLLRTGLSGRPDRTDDTGGAVEGEMSPC